MRILHRGWLRDPVIFGYSWVRFVAVGSRLHSSSTRMKLSLLVRYVRSGRNMP